MWAVRPGATQGLKHQSELGKQNLRSKQVRKPGAQSKSKVQGQAKSRSLEIKTENKTKGAAKQSWTRSSCYPDIYCFRPYVGSGGSVDPGQSLQG